MGTVNTYTNGQLVDTATFTTPPEVVNADTLRDKAIQALAADLAFVNASKPSTAAAQASQAYDQAVKLTRQMIALIRLVVNDTSDITGT